MCPYVKLGSWQRRRGKGGTTEVALGSEALFERKSDQRKTHILHQNSLCGIDMRIMPAGYRNLTSGLKHGKEGVILHTASDGTPAQAYSLLGGFFLIFERTYSISWW